MVDKKSRRKSQKSNNKTRSKNRISITLNDIKKAQKEWANNIKNITKDYFDKKDYVKTAKEGIDNLYDYDKSIVLFKPTKAVEHPFRSSKIGALSYFVGHKAIKGGYTEDKGFAINGGKGWKSVIFNNNKINYNGNTATAMGTYVFTCATTDNKVKVYYTFGYKLNKNGKVRIYLHHSSVPFSNK
jgi:hypothetical protein